MIKPFLPSNISIGSLQFSLYGALLGLGFALIIWQIERKFPNKFKTWDYIIIAISTVIGAKLAYAISSGSWDELFSLSVGGLRIYGAILLGGITIYIISTKRKVDSLKLFDNIAFVVPIAQVLGRIGNFINQEIYGKPCNHNLCLSVDQNKRLAGYKNFDTFHPLFLYESILNLLNLLILIVVSKRLKPGGVTLLFLFNYAIIRLVINRFRIDQTAILYGLDVSDIASIAIIAFVLVLAIKKRP